MGKLIETFFNNLKTIEDGKFFNFKNFTITENSGRFEINLLTKSFDEAHQLCEQIFSKFPNQYFEISNYHYATGNLKFTICKLK